MPKKNHRDAATGRWTTAADAAKRPAETVAETVSYRKKPVTIEARQFDGTNAADIAAWCGGKVASATCHGDGPPYLVVIDTLEGRMVAGRDDYVIRGVQGEFYPCKPDIFAATYEPAETRHTPTEAPDVAELRRLAEARPMPGSDWYEFKGLTKRYILSADAAFIAAASPGVVLGLLDRLAHMTEARDNARAEVERLAGKVEAVRALHETWRIHSDGDHPEGCDCGEPTYIVCRSCCCDAYGDQSETCAIYHDHDTDGPGCPTIRALDGGAES